MIFQHGGERIVLIDFLDSYIEAPILDVAKLLQDTRAGWTRRTAPTEVDQVSHDRATRTIEEIVLDRVGHHFSTPVLEAFEFQNLLRVSAHLEPGVLRSVLFSRLCDLTGPRS